MFAIFGIIGFLYFSTSSTSDPDSRNTSKEIQEENDVASRLREIGFQAGANDGFVHALNNYGQKPTNSQYDIMKQKFLRNHSEANKSILSESYLEGVKAGHARYIEKNVKPAF